MAQKKDLPTILETTAVAQSHIFGIERLKLRFSNGNERYFERLKGWGPGVVMIAPMLDANTVLLIREYAAGINQYTLSLPKGRIEIGEAPESAANRECQEEVGYKATKLHLLSTMTNAPQYNDTQFHLFVATDLEYSPLEGDEPEPLEVIPWKMDNLSALFAHEEVHEARSIAALYMLRDYLEQHHGSI